MKNTYTHDQLAKLAGVHRHTLKRYRQKGLIMSCGFNGRATLYSVETLSEVKRLKKTAKARVGRPKKK